MSEKPSELASPERKKTSMSLEDFNVKHKLGKGAYGDVYLVEKNSDKKLYALKQIQKKKLARQQKEYQAMVEKQLLSVIKHPGIIKLRYAFQDKVNLNFVEELCEGGEFTTFIKYNSDKLTENIRRFYVAEIVNLLEYLHKNGITHRDLKPQNLMLDKLGHLKLIDFGTAEITKCKIISEEFKAHINNLKQKSEEKTQLPEDEEEDAEDNILKKRRSTFVGTCYYISPELLEFNICPASADLWALGCIIYQLYYLQTPFTDNYQFAVFQKIKKAEVKFPKNENISEDGIDLIKRLLVKDPDERIGSGMKQQLSYEQLKAHPYFKGININNIFESSMPFVDNLQIPEKTTQENTKKQEYMKLIKEKEEEMIKSALQQGQKLQKAFILQEKSFIFYNCMLLVLTDKKNLYLIDQSCKSTKLKAKGGNLSGSIKQTKDDRFQFQAQERVYYFRSKEIEQIIKFLG